jgi:(p)ppGpp synthase/HD superfamily hydrolase
LNSAEIKYRDDYSKLEAKLRDAGYSCALKALKFAREYHQGVRKDKKTPNFHHQVSIALNLYIHSDSFRKAGLNPDEVIAEGILHDTYEEHQDLLPKIRKLFPARVAFIVEKISKVRDGKEIPTLSYFQELLEYPETIIVKLHDRHHNVETISGLTPAKRVKYFCETRQLLDIVEDAIERYDLLEGILRHSHRQIEQLLKQYTENLKSSTKAKHLRYVRAFHKAGLITLSKRTLRRLSLRAADPRHLAPKRPTVMRARPPKKRPAPKKPAFWLRTATP